MKEREELNSQQKRANLGARNRRWFGTLDMLLDVEELNLVEFPLALLSRHVPSNRKHITFEDTIFDKTSKERINRTLEISANATSKLPNWWDQDFLLALMVLTNRKNGWSQPVVEFTAYEVLKLMRLGNETKNRRLVAKSFDNWQGVRVKYSHWRKGESWIEPKAFSIIQDYDLTRKGREEPDAPQVFAWSRILFESMQAEYVKPFDADFYFSLKSPMARRACRFLDKRLYKRAHYEAPITAFCRNKLGMSEYRWAADYRSKLNPAYDELVAKGFLADVSRDKRFPVLNGEARVHFRRGLRAKGSAKSTTRKETKRPELRIVEKQIDDVAVGVNAANFGTSNAVSEVEQYLSSLPDEKAREEFEHKAAQRPCKKYCVS